MYATVETDFAVLEYKTLGSGSKILFCFPGYGKEIESLELLEETFGEKYTLVLVNLFYHGNSRLKSRQFLSRKEMIILLDLILEQIGKKGSNISFLGYSIGGRVALNLAVMMKKRVDELWLIGADGINNDTFYRFCTRNSLGKFLFRAFVPFPYFIQLPIEVLYRIRLINKNLYYFFNRRISNKKRRLRLFKIWNSLKEFSVDSHSAKKEIIHSDIKLMMVYGKNDSVIGLKPARKFAHNCDNAQLLEINMGHHLIKPELNHYLKKLLNERNVGEEN